MGYRQSYGGGHDKFKMSHIVLLFWGILDIRSLTNCWGKTVAIITHHSSIVQHPLYQCSFWPWWPFSCGLDSVISPKCSNTIAADQRHEHGEDSGRAPAGAIEISNDVLVQFRIMFLRFCKVNQLAPEVYRKLCKTHFRYSAFQVVPKPFYLVVIFLKGSFSGIDLRRPRSFQECSDILFAYT